MTNTTVPADAIVAALDQVNSSCSVRTDYSGRGMYGSTCFGIDFEGLSAAFEFFAALGQYVAEQQEFDSPDCDADLATDLASAASYDSMGLGVVVYFRRFEIEGDLGSYGESDNEEYADF